MREVKFLALTIVIIESFIAFAFWMNGYNFDHRGPDAFGWVIMSGIGLLFSFIIIPMYELAACERRIK